MTMASQSEEWLCDVKEVMRLEKRLRDFLFVDLVKAVCCTFGKVLGMYEKYSFKCSMIGAHKNNFWFTEPGRPWQQIEEKLAMSPEMKTRLQIYNDEFNPFFCNTYWSKRQLKFLFEITKKGIKITTMRMQEKTTRRVEQMPAPSSEQAKYML